MKDKLIKLTLGLVQFLIDVGIVSTFFITFAIVTGGICCLISPRSILGGPLTGSLVIQGLVVIALMALSFICLVATHRLLDNLNQAKYFVVANCQALQKILWTTVTNTVIGGATTIWLSLAHVKPRASFLVMTGDDFSNSVTLIIILLIIYLIFKRGVALQNDADSIIWVVTL